jgi:hypothetical protein
VVDDTVRATLTSELDRVDAALLKRRPVKGASVVALDEALALITKVITNREQARKLADQLRQLCG